MTGKTNHDFGCLMLFFDFPGMSSFHSIIEPNDIYTQDGYGLETEPHVTLLYGFHKDVKPKKVLDLAKSFDYNHCKIYNVSLFENLEYDVLKFDVDLEILKYVHGELRNFPHTDVYSTYHPHMTIGYLKPGTGHKYIDKLKWVKLLMTPNKIVYSKSNGQKTIVEI